MNDSATLFLCGDVMTGRGIDQIMPQPSAPVLYERYVRDARRYVELARAASGPVEQPVAFDYIWGDALAEFERRRPDVRIINLETSITTADRPWPKGINYRMHPGNTPCLSAADIDCCALANNHVLDWRRAGLNETVESLHRRHIHTAGAGGDLASASRPAVLSLPGGQRLLVFSAATEDCGVPPEWAATGSRSGVLYLDSLSEDTLQHMVELIERYREAGDRVVFSIHWGGNWGYDIPREQQRFARGLIEHAGVDIVHGHSSHHLKAIEVHRERLILYGCGDFLNDYEGIGGHDRFRGELSLMYFPELDMQTGALRALDLVPMRIQRLRVVRAPADDRRWLAQTLNGECRKLDAAVRDTDQGHFQLQW